MKKTFVRGDKRVIQVFQWPTLFGKILEFMTLEFDGKRWNYLRTTYTEVIADE